MPLAIFSGFYGLCAAGGAVLVGICYLIKPLRKLAGFLAYTLFCVVLLAVLCHFSPQLGLTLTFNLKTASISAILGLPGIALLMVLNIFL